MLRIYVLTDGELVATDVAPVAVTRDDRAAMYADLFGDSED